MDMFLSQCVNGLNNTSLLLLVALGMSIIFGIMGVINMAHGELVMIGAYVTCFISNTLKLPIIVSILASMLITAIVGILIEVVVVRHLYNRVIETMLATYGVSLVLQQIVRTIFGNGTPKMISPIKGTFNIGAITIPNYNIFVLLVAIIALSFTGILFYRTKIGKEIRGITQNRTMCECLGIDSGKIDTITFAYGAALAGLAGCILSPLKNISVTMGSAYLTDSFMTVIVGGINSLFGTAVGSFLIGEPSIVLGGYMSEITAKIIVLILVVIFIRSKPEGIFKTERR